VAFGCEQSVSAVGQCPKTEDNDDALHYSRRGGYGERVSPGDVSQKTTAICVVDEQGRQLWRGSCATDPGAISVRVWKHAGVEAKVGVETGSMTPWLVHGLRGAGVDVECLDARRVKAALQMRLNKSDENDAEGLAQIMRTGWYRPVHVKSLDAHRARALLGARAQLVGMTTRLSNMIRGVLKTFGLLPGAGRGLRFDRKVEALLDGAPEIALIVRPLLAAWRELSRSRSSIRRCSDRSGRIQPAVF
jgi:transposase